VDPAYRRKGIGERLLRAALECAADQGAELATLEVRASNDAALELYRKHAFEVVGRRPRYYRDNGEDALLMTRRGLTARSTA
ncbi:MAG TPA: GNAT family N-acetyltransferase, partial [Anaerolineales bacterium]